MQLSACEFLNNALSEARVKTTQYASTRSIKRLVKVEKASPGSGLVFGVQSVESSEAALEGPLHCSGGRLRIIFRSTKPERPASATGALIRPSDRHEQ